MDKYCKSIQRKVELSSLLRSYGREAYYYTSSNKFWVRIFQLQVIFQHCFISVVDANYNFIFANVGTQGRISDGGVFNQTRFKECMEQSTMKIPPSSPLPGQNDSLPFVFVGDDAFPLSKHIMKPYPGLHDKGSQKRVLNYRLSCARRVSENAFGILSAVFRVLRKHMLLEPDTATKIVLAVLYLHNYLRKRNFRNLYNPVGTFDIECPETGEIISMGQ